MKDIDLLIINPGSLREVYQTLSTDLAAKEPPIWAALLAQGIRKAGFSVALLDCEAHEYTKEEIVAKLGEYRPGLTAIVVYGQQPSASTQNMYAAGLTAKIISENFPNYKSIMLGGHISALPERTLREESVTFVAKGEGYFTLLGMLQINLNNPGELSTIPGLYFRDGNEIRKGKEPLIVPQERLSELLPGMAWDLLPMDKYRAHNWHCFEDINHRTPYASLYTSLGCPFKCSFCCINAPFGGPSFRYWDPDIMVKEFDLLATKYGVTNIKIADEMFVLNEKHFLKLCENIKNLGHKFNIWAYARVDTIKEKHLVALKAAGVNWIALGIESFSKYVRDGVNKGRFGAEDITRVVRMIQNAGINVHANYIFGLPDDDLISMKETLKFSMDLNAEMSNFYGAMAYPGSALYDLALQEGLELPGSWLGYSQHSKETKPLPTKFLKSGEVLYFRDWAWQSYYTNPAYLELVRKKFGEDAFLHVKNMTKHKLERNHAITIDNLTL